MFYSPSLHKISFWNCYNRQFISSLEWMTWGDFVKVNCILIWPLLDRYKVILICAEIFSLIILARFYRLKFKTFFKYFKTPLRPSSEIILERFWYYINLIQLESRIYTDIRHVYILHGIMLARADCHWIVSELKPKVSWEGGVMICYFKHVISQRSVLV